MQRAADDSQSAFIWRDAGRSVIFDPRLAEEVAVSLAKQGVLGRRFHLLTTPRRVAAVPGLADLAEAVHEVPGGGVPEAAASLLETATGDRLVALGGGRVIDTAKAVAAVSGARVAAIPTTMSGAEMTGIHRQADVDEERIKGKVRPERVLADPGLMTGQEEDQLRASAMNALAHGADSLCTPYANPMSRHAGLRGAGLIASALDEARATRDRSSLALGSILCGYAIDSGGFGVHHVMCQTLVRTCGTWHAETNALMLPLTIEPMMRQDPAQRARLAAALGVEPDALSARIARLAGPQPSLAEQGGDGDRTEEAIDQMLMRPDLTHVPDPPDRAELRRMVQAAW